MRITAVPGLLASCECCAVVRFPLSNTTSTRWPVFPQTPCHKASSLLWPFQQHSQVLCVPRVQLPSLHHHPAVLGGHWGRRGRLEFASLSSTRKEPVWVHLLPDHPIPWNLWALSISGTSVSTKSEEISPKKAGWRKSLLDRKRQIQCKFTKPLPLGTTGGDCLGQGRMKERQAAV